MLVALPSKDVNLAECGTGSLVAKVPVCRTCSVTGIAQACLPAAIFVVVSPGPVVCVTSSLLADGFSWPVRGRFPCVQGLRNANVFASDCVLIRAILVSHECAKRNMHG